MREITTTTKVYTFNELSESAQDRAIDSLRYAQVDYGWWEAIYDDALTVGVRITEFDLDRSRHANGELGFMPVDVANLIMSEHGPDTDTFKLAAEYLDEVQYTLDDELSDLDQNFKYDLLECYSVMLQNEYECLTGDESIKELIEINEYEFNETGGLI